MSGHMTNNDMGREGVLANNDVMKSLENRQTEITETIYACSNSKRSRSKF